MNLPQCFLMISGLVIIVLVYTIKQSSFNEDVIARLGLLGAPPPGKSGSNNSNESADLTATPTVLIDVNMSVPDILSNASSSAAVGVRLTAPQGLQLHNMTIAEAVQLTQYLHNVMNNTAQTADSVKLATDDVGSLPADDTISVTYNSATVDPDLQKKLEDIKHEQKAAAAIAQYKKEHPELFVVKRKYPRDLQNVATSPNVFVLRPTNMCQGRNLTLVICVPIRRPNFEIREDIRDTWGSYGVGRNSSVALAFFLGSAKQNEDPSVQKRIQLEFNFHRDIIQGSFIDDYKNLTLKSVFFIHWIAEYCRNTKYVLKADDDVFVNIPLLIHVMRNQSSHYSHPFIIGKRHDRAKPNRRRKHKWGVSKVEYPGKLYPNYVNGGSGYAMTSTAALILRDASSLVDFHRLEDIFLTGIVANRSGVHVFNDRRFTTARLEPKGRLFTNQITSGHCYGKDKRTIFSEMMKMNVTSIYSDAVI